MMEDHDFSAVPAGSPQDLRKAVETWDLDQFTFQVRPFNPHPSNPGELLSDLMAKDSVAELRGVALPLEGEHIHPADEGLVKEALGLADEGYGTFGASGRTPSGAEAIIKKQSFSRDRGKNLEKLKGPQQVRVYISGEDENTRIAQAVSVLVEFFGSDTISTT
jgi:hypothetical protein